MTRIMRSALVPFSPTQMYELVNTIEDYPEFLPWCAGTQILSRSATEIQATVHVAKGIFHKSFTTTNRLLPNQRIEMRLVQGPFSHLEGTWEFIPTAQGTQVTLNLSFEFANRLATLTLGPLFQQIASSMVQAFTQRAYQVYVNRSSVAASEEVWNTPV